jgi:Stage II sporulation protein E (SpoIIE)
MTDGSIESLVTLLDGASPADVVELAVGWLGGHGFPDAVLWVADVTNANLVDGSGILQSRPVDGSVEGRALVQRSAVAHAGRVHLPMAQRGRVLGVMSVDADPEAGATLIPVATVVAASLLSTSGHSDVLAALRGGDGLALAATIQHDLLPHPGYEDRHVQIGGQVEPAFDIAGDSYDYAVNDGVVDLAIFDAVGHGLRSALMAVTVVGAYRRARRREPTMGAVAASIEGELAPALGRGDFVTGVVARLDLVDHALEVRVAGHPPPILVRDGTANFLQPDHPAPPFGLSTAGAPFVTRLQPGDMVMLYTDGVVQARDRMAVFLGAQALADVALSHDDDVSVQATCRRALARVVDHVQGPLADDATVLALRVA